MLHPVMIFVTVHSIAALAFFMQLSDLLNPYTTQFALTIFLVLMAFPVGYSSYVLILSSKRNFVKNSKKRVGFQKLQLARFVLFNRLGAVCYIAALVVELYFSNWVFPAFSSNPLQAYYDFPVRFVHYIVVCSIPITLVIAYSRSILGYYNRQDLLIIGVLLVCNTLILARAIVLTQLFVMFYFWAKDKYGCLSLKQLVVPIFLGLTFVSVVGVVRTGDDARIILDIGGLSSWPEYLIPLSWPYLYFATSLENFRAIYESLDFSIGVSDVSFGARWLLVVVYTLFQSKESIPQLDLDGPSAGGFNTYGIYHTAFMDFGVFFPIYFLLLSIVIAAAFNSRSILFQIFKPYLLYCLLTSPINDYFTSFFTVVYFAYLYLIVSLSKVKGRINRVELDSRKKERME